MKVKEYTPDEKGAWDEFVENSNNGTFLFHRDFMDYHSNLTDKFEPIFTDNSLLFYEEDSIRAIFPANSSGTTLETHGGLTYGGLILSSSSPTREIFDSLLNYVEDSEFENIYYKDVPFIYHSTPNQRIPYEIYRHNGEIESKGLSSVIDLRTETSFRRDRERGIETANEHNIEVRETDRWEEFWEILRTVLDARHGAEPTHSLEEITYLNKQFPNNIHLYGAFEDDELVAGIVVFETDCVAHSQYNANTLHGRDIGANDLLHSQLIRNHFRNKQYFDFGVSTEDGGLKLNEGLLNYKESFGASSITYDHYQISPI